MNSTARKTANHQFVKTKQHCTGLLCHSQLVMRMFSNAIYVSINFFFLESSQVACNFPLFSVFTLVPIFFDLIRWSCIPNGQQQVLTIKTTFTLICGRDSIAFSVYSAYSVFLYSASNFLLIEFIIFIIRVMLGDITVTNKGIISYWLTGSLISLKM